MRFVPFMRRPTSHSTRTLDCVLLMLFCFFRVGCVSLAPVNSSVGRLLVTRLGRLEK